MVNIFHMSSQIAALSKSLPAELAVEGPLASVLSEMVPEVAGLFKNASALRVHAPKIQLDPLSLRIPDLYSLMEVLWDVGEGLGLAGSLRNYRLVVKQFLHLSTVPGQAFG